MHAPRQYGRNVIALHTVLLLWLSATNVAVAEESVADFLRESDNPGVRLIARVAGLSLSRANARLAVDRNEPFFCPSASHVISTDEYIETLRRYISQHDTLASDASDLMPMHMLSALMEKYPCPAR